MQPIDIHPGLPKAIDIGGDRYYFGSEKPVELGYKNKKDFIISYHSNFVSDSELERLFRKYFYLGADPSKIQFDTPEDKNNIINILEQRAKILRLSNEFTSSLLINTISQRTYINIQKIIEILKGPSKSSKNFKLPELFEKDKKYVENLTEDQILLLIIEISFYLLHPSDVPDSIRSKWYSLIKQLDTLRPQDLVNKLQDLSGNILTDAKPLNHFAKQVYFKQIKDSKETLSALQQAIDIAKKIQDENATEIMKKKLEAILSVLQAKKYINNELGSGLTNENIGKIKNKINKSMIENPINGELEKSLKEAFIPFLDYFKQVYNPVYDILEKSVTSFKSKNSKNNLSQLLKILELMNKINSEPGKNGIIKINGVDDATIKLIKQIIVSVNDEIAKLPENSKKTDLISQITSLPKVKISSILGPTSSLYKNPEESTFIGLFTVGSNITLLDKTNYKSTMSENSKNKLNEDLKNYFTDKSLYLIKSEKISNIKDTPLALYTVDLTKIKNISEIQINTKDLEIKDVMNIEEQNIVNDSELALAILIAFKELMPQ